MCQYPILIVLSSPFTMDDIAGVIQEALAENGMQVEQHNISACVNPDAAKHPHHYDALTFKFFEHHLFSTGHKHGSMIVTPPLRDDGNYHTIGIHVIGAVTTARQAVIQRLHRVFTGRYERSVVDLIPHDAVNFNIAYMPHLQECVALADLKDTVVNIAYRKVRDTVLLDDVMREVRMAPAYMRKSRV